MKESVLKTFWRDTYQSRSPIPFILSAQIILFVLIHIFDLLKEVELIQIPLYDYTLNYLSLPLSIDKFIIQPWSLATYPFLYTGLFQLIFDCLWLYWIGNIFLNFLNRKQFLFVYISSIVLGATLYLLLGLIPLLQHSVQLSFHSAAFVLGALVTAIATLVPHMELKLFLFGRVQLKIIAMVYIAIELVFITLVNKAGGIAFLGMVFWGAIFTLYLKNGRDLSLLFHRRKRTRLRVVHKNSPTGPAHNYRHQSDLPNQEEIDEILDKISLGGYKSLTSQEKEILFRASKGER